MDKRINTTTTKIRMNKNNLIDRTEQLSMDSGEFERLFDVYSDNKVETMQILTLDIMQQIIDFTNKVKLIPEFTIKGHSIYVRFGYPKKNILDIDDLNKDVLENQLDYEKLKRYYDIFNFIEKITDDILRNLDDAGIE